jgi:hypothetical protein
LSWWTYDEIAAMAINCNGMKLPPYVPTPRRVIQQMEEVKYKEKKV